MRLKPREERRKVLVSARMRCGVSWQDVCIVDIASRGVGVQAVSPPERGEYVEIRWGGHVIIGQVVWASQHRFGLQVQGPLPVSSIVSRRDRVADVAPAEDRCARAMHRRKHEASRHHGQLMEFAFIALAGLFAVASVGMIMWEAFATPIATISSTLANHSSANR